ncbi:MAG: hypothetical protein ACTHMX_00790 [Thermomicrobiales bacterium]|jgi:threonine/homoserine/homoserine lactone efflux protein
MLVSNMGLVFGVLSDTVEVILAVLMMIGGIVLTWAIQKWADRAGEHPGAANVGQGGGSSQYEQRSIRN